MIQELQKSLERKLFVFVGLLIGSNAYFVERVISSVDRTTQEVSALKIQVAQIETQLKYSSMVDPDSLESALVTPPQCQKL